jgi:hypothetical protein
VDSEGCLQHNSLSFHTRFWDTVLCARFHLHNDFSHNDFPHDAMLTDP